MVLEIDARFEHIHAFGFEELFLEGGVGLADQNLAILTHDAMPRDAFARWRRGHGTPGATCSAAKAQSFSERPIR